MKLVSIGMPVFNDRSFLSRALDSLINQSYTNFELILSDDCSTDGSAQICEEYALKDKRINYIRQDKNIGISRNMEFLLRRATGEYFMWAGDDDLWHPNFISSHVKALEISSKIISAFCPYLFIDENDMVLRFPSLKNRSYESKISLIRLLKLSYYWDDGFGYGMFRREKILNVKFPVWWWVNKKRAYNNIYPTLFYYLSLGEYKHIGGQPLWYNRLKNNEKVNHKIPYSKSAIKKFIFFCLWKFNVYVKCIESIFRSKIFFSIFNILIIIPVFMVRYTGDIIFLLQRHIASYYKKK